MLPFIVLNRTFLFIFLKKIFFFPHLGGIKKKRKRENKAILSVSCPFVLIIERKLVLYLVKGAGRSLTSDTDDVLGA